MTDFIIKDPRTAKTGAERMQRELAAHRAFEGARDSAVQNITPEDMGINLAKIVWPADKYLPSNPRNAELRPYDYYHHKFTMQLAIYIAEGFEGDMKLSHQQLKVLKTAAFLHDLGREAPWQKDDPGHAMRGAEIARKLLVESPLWSERETIDDVCKLIANHSLNKLPEGPLLTALHDAECFESARFAPNTHEGIAIMRERMSKVVLQWSKNPEHQARWRKNRGW
jgi:hypothetical protein